NMREIICMRALEQVQICSSLTTRKGMSARAQSRANTTTSTNTRTIWATYGSPMPMTPATRVRPRL
ncbi:MAG: hypothetical protein ABJP76_04655, partial [Flavobacteriaceae bacterium]